MKSEKPGKVGKKNNDQLASSPSAAETSRGSEERFRSLLEGSRDVFYRFNLQTGQYEYISPSAQAVWGYTPEEFIALDAKTRAAMIHPDDRPVLQTVETRLTEIDHAEAEYRQQTRNGDYRWLSNQMSLRRDEQGQPLYRDGSIRDITERKNHEQALRSTLESIGDGFFACDAEWRLVYVNAKAERLLGIQRDAVLGKNLWELFPPALGTRLEQEYRRAAAGEIRDFDNFYEPWGRWFYNRCFPREGGGLSVYFEDITERKQSELQLARMERLLSEGQRIAHVGSWEYLVDTQQTVWSEEEYRIYGLEPAGPSPVYQEMLAKSIHPGDAARLDETFRQALQNRSQWEMEHRIVRPDGSVRVLYDVAHPYLDDQGKLVKYIGTSLDITERKLAEEKLRHSELKYRQLHNTLRDAFVSVDMSGRIQECNSVFEEMLGYTCEELRRLTYVDLTPEKWHAFEARLVAEEVLPKGSSRVYEKEYRRKDGTVFPVELRTCLIRNHAGQPEQMWAIVRDITERKRAEEALQESERLYRAIGESIDYGIWICDPQGRNTYTSESFLKLVGITQEQCAEFRWGNVLHPEDAEATIAAWKQCVQTGGSWYREHRYRGADGKYHPILACGVPVRDERGQITCWAGINLDISRLKQAEEALRVSEERFRVAQELSPDGFSILRPVRDEHGKVVDFTWVYINATTARMIGTDPKQVAGRSLLERFPGHRGTDILQAYQDVAETGERRVLEAHYSGETIAPTWFRLAIVPVGNDIAVLAQDITHQKEFQAALEREVAERTARLQELVGELEHFSYTITHDLKSPLRAMKGYADMAMETCEDRESGNTKEFLGRISRAAERMDALIRDALNYSRAVRQELPLEDVDVGALLRGMLETYPELQPSKAQIRIEGRLPVVLGNAAGLTQCFSNLLGNAVKFVNPGQTPEVQVWAEHCDGWARIWVVDHGIGISQQMLPRVWDMFSRESKSYEGTGIGLALVKKAVQRMGGRVGVESEPGKGSRFWIELKLGEARASEVKAVLLAAKTQEGTVLYVEDEENDAMFMERAFAGKGLKSSLRVVGDGRAAMEYLSGAGKYGDREQFPLPAIVLLDLNLPAVPGFEVLKWMRNHPDFMRTPVVVFTSSTREDDQMKARELGASEFIVKPMSAVDFGTIVERLQEKWLAYQ